MKKVFLLSFLFIFLSAGNSLAAKQQVCIDSECADVDFYREGGIIKATVTPSTASFYFFWEDISIVQNGNIIGVIMIVGGTDTKAYIQCSGISDCYGTIKQGVTYYLNISDFPGGFNINQAFMVYYGNTVFNIDAVTTTTTIIPITITNHVMTKTDPNLLPVGETPPSVSNFSTQDDYACCWFSYENGTINSLIEWKFYGPNSSLYLRSYKIQNTSGCEWNSVYPREIMSGNWYVDVYYAGIKQFTETFTITSPTTTTSIQPTTSSIPITTSTTTTVSGGICAAEAVLENDKESLDLLREFRDAVLIKSEAGRKYVKLYYEWSPQIILLIESDHVLRKNLKQYLQSIMPAIKSELAVNHKK